MPLPDDRQLGIAQLPRNRFQRPLFGLGEAKNRTAFIISAEPVTEQGMAAQRALPQTSIRIHGQEFGKYIAQPNKHDKNVAYKTVYMTFRNSYLLRFEIRSLDPSMVKDLEHRVEQIEFFDPAKAKEIAGPNGKPYNPLVQVQAK